LNHDRDSLEKTRTFMSSLEMWDSATWVSQNVHCRRTKRTQVIKCLECAKESTSRPHVTRTQEGDEKTTQKRN